MYSIEVKTAIPGAGQAGVAFKVDSQSRPVPKGPDDMNNPYSAQTNATQFNAYQRVVIKAGHKVAP